MKRSIICAAFVSVVSSQAFAADPLVCFAAADGSVSGKVYAVAVSDDAPTAIEGSVVMVFDGKSVEGTFAGKLTGASATTLNYAGTYAQAGGQGCAGTATAVFSRMPPRSVSFVLTPADSAACPSLSYSVPEVPCQ